MHCNKARRKQRAEGRGFKLAINLDGLFSIVLRTELRNEQLLHKALTVMEQILSDKTKILFAIFLIF